MKDSAVKGYVDTMKKLETCPLCQAPLVSHTLLEKKDKVRYLWCSKEPLHFRWEYPVEHTLKEGGGGKK